MKRLADIRQAFDASPVDIAVPPYPDDLAQFRLLFEPLHDDTITRLDGGRGDFHRMQDFPQPVFFRLRKVYVIHHLGKIVFPLFIAIEMPSFDDLPAVHDVDPVVIVDLIVALIQGVVLCVDELDTNLHTGLLQFLFLPFLSSSNSSHAQLIFTCHDYDLLDEMMKYRTYLFEKEKGESYCYRLDEINGAALRNDRSLSQQYKSGALGGVPRVKEE